MRHFFILPAVLVVVALCVAQEPTPKNTEAAKLVEKLGSPDFQEREAATKQLEALGTTAIEELRLGVKSDNPEMAQRSQDLLRKAERRLASDKVLAPTLVELDAKDQPLDAVLAELSKQTKWEVVLGGLKPEDLAVKKITLSTGGKVAFWAAVLKLCDAADMQIAGVSGFVAPGAMPYLGRAKVGVRIAADRNRAVVLEARDGAPKRPASLHGAVLIEAVPFPKNAMPLATQNPSALLQAWPEPRLQWEGASATKITRATDATGVNLPAEFTPIPTPDLRATGNGTVMIRNPDGSVTFVKDTGSSFQLPGGFKPNVRQAVIQFKPGEKAASSAKELNVSLFATVRTGFEPLCQIRDLESGKAAKGFGPGDVELSILYSTDTRGKLVASVNVAYDRKAIHLAGVGDDLPGIRGGGGFGNSTVCGVRLTDANGKAYTLGLSSGSNHLDQGNKRLNHKLELELHPEKEGHGPPAVISFWGTQAKSVELPILLKDVPLAGGR
ncbi:MAG: hypothetical protein K8U57_13475 [Planctomycetes bacterium]|nr:hypothetical protein [Planctomycetota bacterium]